MGMRVDVKQAEVGALPEHAASVAECFAPGAPSRCWAVKMNLPCPFTIEGG
jgi:hypothetical protein